MFPEKILLLTWEYPPSSFSPIAHYSKKLSDFLSSKGVNVVVLTHDSIRPNMTFIENDNLFVLTIGSPLNNISNPLNWSLTMAYEMERAALDALREENVDAIHAQDWLTLPAALLLKEHTDVPLFLTFHSIEPTRVKGISDPYIEAVKRIEKEGAEKAEKIFVNSLWMKYQVMYHYGVPEKKLEVINPYRKDWPNDVLHGYGVMKK